MKKSGIKCDIELWQPLLCWIEDHLRAATEQGPAAVPTVSRPVLRAVK